MAKRGRFPVVAKERRTADGIVFASMNEMLRYCDLKRAQQAGLIHELTLQPKFDFVVNGAKVGSYKADFRYLTKEGVLVIEDRKSSGSRRDEAFGLRMKLMKACFGIDVKITGR